MVCTLGGVWNTKQMYSKLFKINQTEGKNYLVEERRN